MDTTEKLSRYSLVACDQAYNNSVVENVTTLAPYLDSPGADTPPNTMPTKGVSID